ncbi:uncharacterized protein LOC105279427 [Ooceraea biroi]|uniref:uncharacterized protein LOC105279427 n=1 Tax=Ooceraea biroi TaxID=2015173 RepID=UPI000F076ACC|nr:uncharacterized protein LOC105279427 [Ooceraea biroi]
MDERELTELAGRVETLCAYFEWELKCDEYLRTLREECARGGGSSRSVTGRRFAAVARIARLEGVRNRLRRRFEYVDAGLGEQSGLSWTEVETAFRNRVLTGAVVNGGYIEPRRFLEDARNVVIERVRGSLATLNGVKVNTAFNAEFVASEKTAVKTIATRNHGLLPTSDLREWYDKRVMEITLAPLDEFQERDSGWALSKILNLTVNVNRSTDNACFVRAVVAALYPCAKHAERVAQYPDYAAVLDVTGRDFPMTLDQMGRFERNNGISINVFAEDDDNRRGAIVPLRLTDHKRNKYVNLLYEPDSRAEQPGHFAWIKDLSRLVSAQCNRKQHRKYICDQCLHYFPTEERLSAHTIDCETINDCAIVLPSEDDKLLAFRNYKRKERAPFVVYVDLECTLEKNEQAKDAAAAGAYQRHRAFSVGYYVRCAYDESLSAYRTHRWKDCVSWFVGELGKLARRVKTILASNVPMRDLTPEQCEELRDAARCHVCCKPFAAGDTRVRDHCHLTGRYRGPAHSTCNLNYKDSHIIPVIFHNLSGYDAHFIIEDVANAFEGSVELLPLTKERYIAFTKNVANTADRYGARTCVKLRFINSYKFLSTSLDKLTSYLDRSHMRILRAEFRHLSEKDFQLLTWKGVFPYEYVDSVKRLHETRLPPRESFHSLLTGDTVSGDNYAHATTVWNRFAIENLGQYSDMYLKTDVLLLADVFENFRDTCIRSYSLDPAHYYTLPGYTWDTMLLHTGIEFELLTDVDMGLFVERGVRGGLSQCSHRYARVNNRYVPSYDPSELSSYLIYYDVNNLYGWAMCQPLPRGEFRWVEDVSTFNVHAIPSDSPTGYILEVDLEYPRHLHDAHADLPFCPTREAPPDKRQEKLLATLCDKQRYVIHYRTLQQCTRRGLRVARIHRTLEFAQSAWLRDYIELNTAFRTRATNDFEKNLYKLMNNAVFGKTMENVRNRVDVKLVTRWEGRYGAEALISRPNFHSRSVFGENLAVELRRLKATFNRPIYVGMCILDISKTRLYEFHYDYMAPLYGDKCRIMYTDTDSLIYRIECEDAYADMRRDIVRFDTSNYPADNAYNMPQWNKKVPGLMKDENNGVVMTEFIGLRAKMYALRVCGKKDTKKIKDVCRSVVGRTITFDDYARCLSESVEMTRQQSRIQSKLHRVYTIAETKLALSPHDDKWYIVPDRTSTLPWGHYAIPQ